MKKFEILFVGVLVFALGVNALFSDINAEAGPAPSGSASPRPGYADIYRREAGTSRDQTEVAVPCKKQPTAKEFGLRPCDVVFSDIKLDLSTRIDDQIRAFYDGVDLDPMQTLVANQRASSIAGDGSTLNKMAQSAQSENAGDTTMRPSPRPLATPGRSQVSSLASVINQRIKLIGRPVPVPVCNPVYTSAWPASTRDEADAIVAYQNEKDPADASGKLVNFAVNSFKNRQQESMRFKYRGFQGQKTDPWFGSVAVDGDVGEVVKNHLGEVCGDPVQFIRDDDDIVINKTRPHATREETYFRGAWVQALVCNQASVLQEVKAGTLKITKIGDAYPCGEFAQDVRDNRKKTDTLAASVAPNMTGLPLKTIVELEKCTSGLAGEASTAIDGSPGQAPTNSNPAVTDSTRQNACYVRATRLGLDAAFKQLVACEAFVRSQGGYAKFFGDQKQIHEEIKKYAINACARAENVTDGAKCYNQQMPAYFIRKVKALWPSDGFGGCRIEGRAPIQAQDANGVPLMFMGFLFPIGAIRRKRRSPILAISRVSVILVVAAIGLQACGYKVKFGTFRKPRIVLLEQNEACRSDILPYDQLGTASDQPLKVASPLPMECCEKDPNIIGDAAPLILKNPPPPNCPSWAFGEGAIASAMIGGAQANRTTAEALKASGGLNTVGGPGETRAINGEVGGNRPNIIANPPSGGPGSW